jgi:hypothetical protein
VSKDNLGEHAALVAAAALLIDYTLTVAVSIAAGVAAVTSAFPSLHVNRVELSLASSPCSRSATSGASASRAIFAIPTYFFIGMILLLLGVGAYRFVTGRCTRSRRRTACRSAWARSAGSCC